MLKLDNDAATIEMSADVEACKAARYDEAIGHFQKATELGPCLTMARSAGPRPTATR